MAEIYFDVDTALSEVPVNIAPLIDDTDFKTIEGAVAYNAAGMALRWHFVTSAGAYTVTSVTPTTAGNYDWTDQGDSGIYTIEIPASGGASINNDTEGYGWFTGVATGVLPWRSPIYGFRAAAINDSWIDANTTGFLAPTTAGRTLDVASTGEAGLDFANVAIPAGAIPALGIIDNGTAQSATGTTLVLRSAAAFADDELLGATIVITGGSAGVGQRRLITDYVSTTDTATVDTWTTTPTGTITYAIFGSAPGSTATPLAANVTQWNSSSVATPTVAGVPEVDVTHYLGSASPALVGGRFDSSVGAMAANVMTAAAAAADLTTELQSGLATQASVNTIDDFLDTEVAAILAAVDTEVAAIKAKTDSLTFTQAGHVDANLQRINDVAVTGDGSGTPFAV